MRNVRVECRVVSDKCGMINYHPIDYTWGANFGAYEFEEPFADSDFNGRLCPHLDQIETVTIDSLNLLDVVLIKLDIEGMEYQALNGAVETIKHSQPLIAFEHHKTNRKAAEQLLKNIGYQIYTSIGQMSVCIPN